jgi:hypothetical protein
MFLVFHSEYLDEMAPKTNYVSEFGHLTRITALFSQMEDAVGQWPPFDFRAFGSGFDTFLFVRAAIVDDDDRFVSAMQEAKTALKVPFIPAFRFLWDVIDVLIHTGMGGLVARTPSVYGRKFAHHEFHVRDTSEHGRVVLFLYARSSLVL